MILSRTLARARIARGERPGWAAAYVPVALDAACLAVVFVLVWGPFTTLAETFNLPLWATITALLALGFIPIQAVLIFSSLWAAKSRYRDEDGNKS
ncbi:hypothetical protein [Pseudooctadecabacter jejudonensis]|uniref:Uncharacterized protein n=1 Tax=Pseudooctadecabacter jejudonensis TaxID=1391910 RepID=A0A1Y5S335_9RHOB|nr:hypothetical protein [Pseudooctadecabacter jejudonensis]SLN31018.1 hypothetical protein PSJ8397_01420 [Pseudooctadecabacter jejudonensis]